MRMFSNANSLKVVHCQSFSLFFWHLLHPDRCQRAVLQDRQMRKEIKVLKDHANFLSDALNIADIFIEFDPIHHNTSLLMLFQVVDTADSCRFTRTGRSA